jgi:hypothetical protein
MYDIPDHIMKSAKDIANSQGFLSNSPATATDSGDVALCAAACVVYASILNDGDKAQANEFKANLVREEGSELLNSKAEQLGWSRKLCLAMRLENDSMPQAGRLAWFNAL